ncbi:cell division protein ZapA [Marichromatium sp. PS1]|uniref:cell division protein ZapA n=1 Tax=Marichromatium sp. PS1 TaxID=3138932 RepID=UPI0032E586B5
MSDEPLQVSIRILDKDYRVACEPHEEEGLRDSARLLDGRMREIRQTGRVIGTDRIAVIAALNIAHELIQLQRAGGVPRDDVLVERLGHLQGQLAEALAHAVPPLDASSEKG